MLAMAPWKGVQALFGLHVFSQAWRWGSIRGAQRRLTARSWRDGGGCCWGRRQAPGPTVDRCDLDCRPRVGERPAGGDQPRLDAFSGGVSFGRIEGARLSW